VTPEVVIYRYLEALQKEPVDVPALARLICTDADLLGRWLTILQAPADPEVLRQHLTAMSPPLLTALARAQAWSMVLHFGTARLALDRWQAVLHSAFLAEAMAREFELPTARTRSLILLAISGVSLSHDPRLRELIEFRGASEELLRDAEPTQQILAVVETLDSVGREAAEGVAQSLLQINPDRFASMQSAATDACQRLLRLIGVTDDQGSDWSERIAAEQQLALLAPLLAARTEVDLAEIHLKVSRSLFTRQPILLLRNASAQLISLPDRDVRVHLDSTASGIAMACREGAARTIEENPESAVADRLVLRRLDCDEGLVLPLIAEAGMKNVAAATVLGALVFPHDEDSDPEFLMRAYAGALTSQLKHRTEAPAQDDRDQALLAYRDGELARLREIVHEANNPLSIVNNYLHILELRLQGEASTQEQLAVMGREIRRAATLFQRAKDVPEPQLAKSADVTPTLNRFDIQAMLRQVTELHRGYADAAAVELEAMLQTTAVMVESDENQLTQVLTNLLKNAIEACRSGDLVTVSLTADVYRNGRHGLEVMVQDSGPGIEPEVLAHLTEPKQSLKGSDHSGLGLAIVYRMVNSLGGSMDVRSSASLGTTFSIFLPHVPA